MTVLLFPLLLLTPQVYAGVDLVVSIRPLKLIADSIVGDNGTTRVLVPVSGSPHHYTMTPSDRLALASAELVVYVGEQLETELHAVMKNLARERRVMELSRLPGLRIRKFPGTESLDPHLWLDSDNGLLIAAAMRDALVEIDPDRASVWSANYTRLEQQLNEAEARWQARLRDLPEVPYAVYHDAIGYFESRFDHDHSVVLVNDPDIQPGIRHLMEVRRAIAEIKPVCLFTDITSRQNTIDTLFADNLVRQQQLDLLGDRLGPADGYRELLDNLTEDFSHCLTGEQRE